MMLSLKTYYIGRVYFIIYILSHLHYHLNFVKATADNDTITKLRSTTLKTFLQDNQAECELDVQPLLELHNEFTFLFPPECYYGLLLLR